MLVYTDFVPQWSLKRTVHMNHLDGPSMLAPPHHEVSHMTTIGGPATLSFANALRLACASHFSS
jgi:hypothetical protein